MNKEKLVFELFGEKAEEHTAEHFELLYQSALRMQKSKERLEKLPADERKKVIESYKRLQDRIDSEAGE